MRAFAIILLSLELGLLPACAQSGDGPPGTYTQPPRPPAAYPYPGRRMMRQFGQGMYGPPMRRPMKNFAFTPNPPAAGPVPNPQSTGAIPDKEKGADKDKGKDKDKDDKECKYKGNVRGDAPCLAWTNPKTPPRAVLLCVHGLGLHSGSWEQFGKRMSGLGFPTYAIDVRGFGSWMKADGHEKVNFEACLDDVKGALKAVRAANPGLPVFLMGESMGGAIALQAAAQNEDVVDGLISSVPAGERFQQKKTDLEVALRLFAGFNRPFDIGKQVIEKATDDPALKAELAGDPLDRLKLAPTELIQFQSFMNRNHDAAKDIKKIPVLIVQGSDDKLVKPEGTVELFQELATSDKDLEMVANAEHLIFEEGQASEKTMKVLTDWLDKRLPPPQPGGAAVPFLSQARQSWAKGEVAAAVAALEGAVRAQPDSSEAHFFLGMAQMKTNNLQGAREHLRKAVRFGRGTIFAKRANQMLMTMPSELLAPATGPGTRQFASGLRRFYGSPAGAGFVPPAMAGNTQPMPAGQRKGRRGRRPGAAQLAPPTVLVFSAKWCEPCKDMASVIEEAKKRFGDRVKFIEIDVDDPANAKLIEQYSVSPVPTVVFLRPDGEVADYAVGYAGIDGMVKGMTKILRGV